MLKAFKQRNLYYYSSIGAKSQTIMIYVKFLNTQKDLNSFYISIKLRHILDAILGQLYMNSI